MSLKSKKRLTFTANALRGERKTTLVEFSLINHGTDAEKCDVHHLARLH
jgi:hypothetical protein